MGIQVRRGNKGKLEPDRLQPGEFAVALDTDEVGIKSGGGMVWFATLDANGKAKQDPASYGKVGGAALISSLPQSTQLAMLHPDGTLSSAGCGLPQSDNNANSSRHYTKYPDGRLHEWGYVKDTISITSAYGSMYLFNHYNITLNHNFVGNVSAHVNIDSSGALIGVGATLKSGTQNVLDFRILSPISVSNLPVNIFYDVWGWWR